MIILNVKIPKNYKLKMLMSFQGENYFIYEFTNFIFIWTYENKKKISFLNVLNAFIEPISSQAIITMLMNR